jgi:hypothetical protein
MNTEKLLIGGGLVALGVWLFTKKQTTTVPGTVGAAVLPSRQIAPNVGGLPAGGTGFRSGYQTPGYQPQLPADFLGGDFGYLPNVGPVDADLIAAALDANTVTDTPSNIVNPQIDPWYLDDADFLDITGGSNEPPPDDLQSTDGSVLPSITIVDPSWGGLV